MLGFDPLLIVAPPPLRFDGYEIALVLSFHPFGHRRLAAADRKEGLRREAAFVA
jgi:hypothetical protein